MNKQLICIFAVFISFISLEVSASSDDGIISLNGKWELSYWKQPEQPVLSPDGMKQMEVKTITGTVPGNVELDLLFAGLIDDPMTGNNVNELRKWEEFQWCYSKSFTSPQLEKGQRLQLFFGGIDCLADIWLNGKHIGKPENMLIEHSFDVTNEIKQGESNLLQVIIRSSVIEG